MPRRTIDLLATGPPSLDPADPAASGWALAHGLASRGHDVQVVYPGPADGPTHVDGVAAVPYSPVTNHLGTVRGDAELAKLAAHHLRSSPDAVVRDPYWAAPSGTPPTAGGSSRSSARSGRRRRRHRPRSGGLPASGSPSPAGGDGASPAAWNGRASSRRRASSARPRHCATGSRASTGVPAERIRITHAAVAHGPPPPAREAARRAVGVPDDVPVIATFVPATTPPAELPASMQQVFARLRVIFVGCRLVAVGLPRSSIAGAVALPSRDAATLGTVASASDAAVLFDPTPAAIPAAVFALRAGLPLVGGPTLSVGDGADGVLRTTNVDDPGELASVLAELLADRGGRIAHEAMARKLAEQYDPGRLADELERSGALGRA